MYDAILDTVFNDPFCSFEARYVPVAGEPKDEIRVTKRNGDQSETVLGQNIVGTDIEIRVRLSEVAAPVKGDRFEVEGVAYKVNAKPMRDARRTMWICACCEAS